MDLCRRTAAHAHPLPVSQVGSNNIQVRLHYIDGNYTVLPEVVEASLGPHMQVLYDSPSMTIADEKLLMVPNWGAQFYFCATMLQYHLNHQLCFSITINICFTIQIVSVCFSAVNSCYDFFLFCFMI